jgi:hypothetical protein
MENPFLMDKSYKVRHKILEVLYTDWETHVNEEGRRVGSIRIANETNIPIADIHRFQNLLIEKGEIVISDNDGQSMITILQNGKSAYVDRRYIKEGVKDKWDRIYNWARIIIPSIALILSIFNLFSNRNASSKTNDLERKTNELEKKIELFKK